MRCFSLPDKRWALAFASCALAVVITVALLGAASASASVKLRASVAVRADGAGQRVLVTVTGARTPPARQKPRSVKIRAAGKTLTLRRYSVAAAAVRYLSTWRSKLLTGAYADKLVALNGKRVKVSLISRSGTFTVSAKVVVQPGAPRISAPADGSTVTSPVTASYSATGATNANVTCQWNAEAVLNPCPASLLAAKTLAAGNNIFTVTATNAAGSVTTTSAFTVLPPPSETAVDTFAPPSAKTNQTVSVSATATPSAGATFQTRFDGGAWTPCASSPCALAIADLTSPAEHTYEITAINAGGPDPTPVRGFIWVDNRAFSSVTCNGTTITTECNSVTPSTTQAGAHPNVAETIALRGSEDPASANITMPQGLNDSLTAVTTKCTVAQASSGSCPDASLIGTLTGTAESPTDGLVTSTGNLYMTDAPATSNAAGIALDMQATGSVSGNLGIIRSQAGVDVTQTQSGTTGPIVRQKITINSIPRQTLTGNKFHLKSITLDLLGDPPGGTYPLITNPFTCPATPLKIIAGGTGYDSGTIANVFVNYPVTGCAAVPFNPTYNQSFTSLVAGEETSTSVTVTLPDGNSTLNTIVSKQPMWSGPNFPAFGAAGDMCSSGSAAYEYSLFNPASCPPQAKVGTMTINTPLLPNPVVGNIYLINKTTPWLGVDIKPSIPGNPQGITLRLIGTISMPQVDPSCDAGQGSCQQQIQAVFPYLPDLPLTSTTLTLGGPPRTSSLGATLSPNMLVNATPPCPPQPPLPGTPGVDDASTTLTPQTGTANQLRTQTFTLTSCEQAPQVNIISPVDSPDGSITVASPVIAEYSTAGADSVTCQWDSEPVLDPCPASPLDPMDLTGGYTTHTFTVTATNGVGPTTVMSTFVVE